MGAAPPCAWPRRPGGVNVEREPILSAAAVASGITAAISLAAAFGLDLSEAQRDAIVGLAPVVAALGTWALARRNTTPWREVVARKDPLGSGIDFAGPAAEVASGKPVIVSAP